MRGANFSRSFFLPLLGRLLTPAVFVAFAFAQTDCKAGDAQAEIDFSKATFTPVEPLLSRDDKPVFVRELYSLRRDEDFRIARFLGFNAAIGHGAAFLELAETADFHVTEASWWGGGTSAETVLNEAAPCDGRSQRIAVNWHDEPGLRMHYASPEHLRPHAMTLKARHPELRVSATLAGSGRALESWPAYAEFLDVMRVDPYPLVSGKPLSHVRDLVVAAQQAASPPRPVVSVLQGWSWAGGALPGAAQIRQILWQSLSAGSSSLRSRQPTRSLPTTWSVFWSADGVHRLLRAATSAREFGQPTTGNGESW
jgi:hypothetical protein